MEVAAIDGEVMTSEIVDFVRRMDKCIQKDLHHLGLPDVIPISSIGSVKRVIGCRLRLRL